MVNSADFPRDPADIERMNWCDKKVPCEWN